AWQAIMKVLPKEAMTSSDIGNNCAIGNAYPTFEQGRKYLAPGLFGPCGYGFPSILGAKIGCPDVPVVGFAGDGAFGISMNEMTACGRNGWPPVTMVVFRNYQWGAEKRNTILWYNDNFVGTELNVGVEYAKIAEACGLKGVKVRDIKELTDALRTAIQEQMNNNSTTFIEVVLNQELGEPFRRDAMKAPVAVAGIDAADMKPQQIS
ncbi:MAG: hypothetical protein KAG70_12890, partial [Alcanivorax sp.]|nr:hypothetical protein [Alcanivorax sp.]